MKNLLIVLLILNTLNNQAQTGNKQLSSREENEYFKIIYNECAEADILELENKEDYVEIEYLCNGQYFEIGISNGQVIFKESQAADSIIPYAKIQRKLEKSYPGWLFDEISLISVRDTSFLKVEILKDGVEQNLFFTIDGKWYKSQSVVTSDKWSVTNLSGSALYVDADYNLLSPDSVYQLPEMLREVSGIALTKQNTLFCVQDELGAVFEYDFSLNKIMNIHRFTDIGDFEDITMKGDTVFILRSDGNVFYFNYRNKTSVNQKMISFNALNFESLSYDETSRYFYVVSKDAILNMGESKRIVYKFPYGKAHNPEMYFEINIVEINQVLKREMVSMESNDVLFNPSAIAIHPVTKEFYILSATDRILAVYGLNGLKKVYPLPAELYYKPEGIAFFNNGDLIISSEGDKRGLVKGSLMYLKYR